MRGHTKTRLQDGAFPLLTLICRGRNQVAICSKAFSIPSQSVMIWTKSKEPPKQRSAHGLPGSHLGLYIQKYPEVPRWGGNKNDYGVTRWVSCTRLSVLGFVPGRCRDLLDWGYHTNTSQGKASGLTEHSYNPRKVHNHSLLDSLDSALRTLRNLSLLWSLLIRSRDPPFQVRHKEYWM